MELLRTPELALRGWEDADVDAFFDVYSHWSVAKWLGPEPRTAVRFRGQAAVRLARWRRAHEAVAPPYGLWAIVPTHLTWPVGAALLLPLEGGEVEVGWHLHPDAQARGPATLAAAALIEASGLDRVLALTDDDNLPSQAVARRLGMVDEGLTDQWFGQTERQFALGS